MIRNFQNLINSYTRPAPGGERPASVGQQSANKATGQDGFKKLPTELLQLIQARVASNPHAKSALHDMSGLLHLNAQFNQAINGHSIVNAYLTRQRQLMNTLTRNRHASEHAPGLASVDSERWLDHLLRSNSGQMKTMLTADTLGQLNQQQQFFLFNKVRRLNDTNTPALFAQLSQQLPQMDETVRRGVVDAIQSRAQHPETGADYHAARAGLARHFSLLTSGEQQQISAEAHTGLGNEEGSPLLNNYLQHHGAFSAAEQSTLLTRVGELEPEQQPVAWQQLAHGAQGFTAGGCETVLNGLIDGLDSDAISPHQFIDAVYAMDSGLAKLDSGRWHQLADIAQHQPPGVNAELYSALAPVMDRLPSSLHQPVISEILNCREPGSRMFALSRLAKHHDKLTPAAQQQLHGSLRGGFDIEDHMYAGIPLNRWDSHNLNKGNVLKNLVEHYPQLPAEMQERLLAFIGGINHQGGVSENVKAGLIAGLAEQFSKATPLEAESLPWQALTAAVATMEHPIVQAQTAQKLSNSLYSLFNQYAES